MRHESEVWRTLRVGAMEGEDEVEVEVEVEG